MNRSLEVQDLTAGHGPEAVLRGVSFRVAAGSRVGLLGPSGCGKTTLLRCIAGLMNPWSGSIHLDGEPLVGPGVNREPAARRIGMVFQSYALWPHLTAREHLQLVAAEADAVEPTLELLHLRHRADHVPGQLSGGEQARLALARALAGRPRLLLLDEPFRNLDPALAMDLQDELHDTLRGEDLSVLLVTHDHREAFALADELFLLQAGRLQATGRPVDLYERPPSEAAAALLGRASRLVVSGWEGTTARTAIGSVAVAADVAARRPEALLARPEDLHARPAPGAAGRVRASAFQGDSCLHRVEAGEAELWVQTDRDHPLEWGAKVEVTARRPLPAWPPAVEDSA